jgi:hypothetical protein
MEQDTPNFCATPAQCPKAQHKKGFKGLSGFSSTCSSKGFAIVCPIASSSSKCQHTLHYHLPLHYITFQHTLHYHLPSSWQVLTDSKHQAIA